MCAAKVSHDHGSSPATAYCTYSTLSLFAITSGELRRASQVPFSCASFWQGLRFAVQKSYGELVSRSLVAALHSGTAALWAQVAAWRSRLRSATCGTDHRFDGLSSGCEHADMADVGTRKIWTLTTSLHCNLEEVRTSLEDSLHTGAGAGASSTFTARTT